ncbi:MAG TPA: biotin--[acetyl-CoA-carboxylase] ligase [Marmoricola sp.]|nr:biotin--[acetyl-CoA-carboxylase] ligase [Marmoricola sp.]
MSDPAVRRSPLEPVALADAAGPSWTVRLLAEAASTNVLAAADARPGLVVVADHQTAGRGRLDRSWETPAGVALTFSAVVDPGLPDARWPLLPLAVAVAVAQAVRRSAGVSPELKWPNDVLVDGRKLAGILLERVGPPARGSRPLAVVGIGLNVDQTADELPVPTATSLRIEGATVERTALFGAVLAALEETLAVLRADAERVLASYREQCSTLGAAVEVQLPGGELLSGTAEAIDGHGRVVVAGRAVAAGDVVHLRRHGRSPGED